MVQYPIWKQKVIYQLASTLANPAEVSPLDKIKQEVEKSTQAKAASSSTDPKGKAATTQSSTSSAPKSEEIAMSLKQTFQLIFETEEPKPYMQLFATRRAYFEIQSYIHSEILSSADNAGVERTGLAILNYLDKKYIKSDAYSVVSSSQRYFHFRILEGDDVRARIEELESIARYMQAIGRPNFVEREF